MFSVVYWLGKNKLLSLVLVMFAIIISQLVYTNHLSGLLAKKDAYHNAYVNKHKELVYESTLETLTQEREWKAKVNLAEGNAHEKISIIRKWHNDAISVNKRLSESLGKANAAIAARSTDTALIEYADTLSTVFRECSKEYETLGQNADGHAVDAVKVIEAWPKQF